MISRILKGTSIGILGAILVILGANYLASINHPTKKNADRVEMSIEG